MATLESRNHPQRKKKFVLICSNSGTREESKVIIKIFLPNFSVSDQTKPIIGSHSGY